MPAKVYTDKDADLGVFKNKTLAVLGYRFWVRQFGSDPNVLTSQEGPHYRNFVDAIRANDEKVLTCGIEDGHLSSALAHMANIAYRVGRKLRFDGKAEKFVGDAEADLLLTRTYRAPYAIPEKV